MEIRALAKQEVSLHFVGQLTRGLYVSIKAASQLRVFMVPVLSPEQYGSRRFRAARSAPLDTGSVLILTGFKMRELRGVCLHCPFAF